MDLWSKALVITLFACLAITFGFWAWRLKQKRQSQVQNFSYWFALVVSISIIFGALFIYSWFW